MNARSRLPFLFSRLAAIGWLILVAMDLVEPFLFDEKRFTTWRIFKIAFLGSVATALLIGSFKRKE